MLKRKGRHRAPASPRSTGTVLVPTVLLAAGGGAFAGLVSTPASAGSRPVRAAAAAEVTPLAAADLHASAVADAAASGTHGAQDSAAKRAAQARAERAIAAARASRARRAAPPPAPAPPADRPVEGGTVQDGHDAGDDDEHEDHDEAGEQEARQDESPRVVRPSGGGLTSHYGRRWGRMHKGVDFGAAYGSPIRAVRGGTVVSAGYDSGGYGNLVLVRHDDGVVTAYAHMSKILVRGGRVSAGEVLGRVGSTGHSTGPHLHFEVRRDGRAVNPVPWLRAHGVDV